MTLSDVPQGASVPGAQVRAVGPASRRGTLPPPRDFVETDEVQAALRRQVNALARRVVRDGELEALTVLAQLRRGLESAIETAVAGARHHPTYPASWAEVADALGVHRQSARERYGHVGGRRSPGGQPGILR